MQRKDEVKHRSFAEILDLPADEAEHDHRSFAEILGLPRMEDLTPGAKAIIAAGEKARGNVGNACQLPNSLRPSGILDDHRTTEKQREAVLEHVRNIKSGRAFALQESGGVRANASKGSKA